MTTQPDGTDISLCRFCFCMTHTVEPGVCGKCGADKPTDPARPAPADDVRAAITRLVTDMTVEKSLSEEFLIDRIIDYIQANYIPRRPAADTLTKPENLNTSPEHVDSVNTSPADEGLEAILRGVFWAGQHNEYPDQNTEPETSVAEAVAALRKRETARVIAVLDKVEVMLNDLWNPSDTEIYNRERHGEPNDVVYLDQALERIASLKSGESR